MQRFLKFLSPLILLSLVTSLSTSCKPQPVNVAPPPEIPSTVAPPPPPVIVKDAPVTVANIIDQVDGTIALRRARTLCELGSRAYATPGYRQSLAWLRSELNRTGWKTIYQAFDTKTPAGDRTYTNLIATWPLASDVDSLPGSRLLLAAHYDSPGSAMGSFPAASSGAAGCGVLLEIAERLAQAPALARRVELIFFDGEEPAQQTSATDGLYGSRFYLQTLADNGRLSSCLALLAYGAIGHTGAIWTLPLMTDPVINQALQSQVFIAKWEGQITSLGRPSWGAHLPALEAGLPATFLNDALYPAFGTADDSADRLDAAALSRAARAGLQLLTLPPVGK